MKKAKCKEEGEKLAKKKHKRADVKKATEEKDKSDGGSDKKAANEDKEKKSGKGSSGKHSLIADELKEGEGKTKQIQKPKPKEKKSNGSSKKEAQKVTPASEDIVHSGEDTD